MTKKTHTPNHDVLFLLAINYVAILTINANLACRRFHFLLFGVASVENGGARVADSVRVKSIAFISGI